MDLVVMGSAFVELIPTRVRVSLSKVPSFELSIGGSAANIAVAASRLEAKVGLLSAVGTDEFGQFVLDELRSERVDVSRVKPVGGYRTGVSFYTVDRKGRKRYHFYRFPGYSTPEATLDEADVDDDYVGSSRAFVLGEACVRRLPSRKCAMAATRSAREKGRLVLYDPNFRSSMWRDPVRAIQITRRFIHLSTITTPNVQEAMLMTGRRGVESAIEDLLDLGPEIVAVKEGGSGCTLATRQESLHVPAFKVHATDDTGAGDAFCAALVVSKLRGMPLRAMALFANAVAAIKVSRMGTKDAMPSLKEAKGFLRSRRMTIEGL